MVRRIWLKGSLIKVSAQLIKGGESAIQTRTWVSILSSGRQRARTTAPAQSIERPEDQAVLPHCHPQEDPAGGKQASSEAAGREQ